MTSVNHPAFFDGISTIVKVSSGEQVIRIHTTRVVALVKNEDIVGKFMLEMLKAPAMGKNPGFVSPELAVTAFKFSGLPFPASGNWIDDVLRVETLCVCFGHIWLFILARLKANPG